MEILFGMKHRMGHFGLNLEEEKSRMIEFGRFTEGKGARNIFALVLFKLRNDTFVEVARELSARRKGCEVLLYVKYFNC